MANPGIPSGGQYPSKAEMQRKSSLGSIFEDVSGLSYDRRTRTGQTAGQVYASDDVLATEWLGTEYQGAGQYYKPDLYEATYDEDNIPDDQSTAFARGSFVDVPTSSTNYSRPRTVAAAWKPDEKGGKVGTMTVVFRDGTFYNYYQVTEGEWEGFHASFSKGRPWLNRRSNSGKPGAQAVDGLFISKPRGPADPESIPAEIREQLYRVSRTQQIVSSRYLRPGKKTHTATNVYTGQKTRSGQGTKQVPEALQRSEHRQSKNTTPGKNPSRNGKNTRRAS